MASAPILISFPAGTGLNVSRTEQAFLTFANHSLLEKEY